MGDDKKSPSPCSINRKFLPVKVAYFTLFGGSASLWNFITLHMKSLGLSPSEIGIIVGTPPFIGSISTVLGGAIADRYRIHSQLSGTLTIVTTFIQILLLFIPKVIHEETSTAQNCSANLTILPNIYRTAWNTTSFGPNETSFPVDILFMVARPNNCILHCCDTSSGFTLNCGNINQDTKISLLPSRNNTLDIRWNCSVEHENNYRFNSSCEHQLKTSGNIVNSNSILCQNIESKQDFYLTNGCDSKSVGLTCTPIAHDLLHANKIHKQFGPTFWVYLTIYGIAGFLMNPIWPLLNAIVYSMLGEDRNSWGKHRLWGTVGDALVVFPMSLAMHFYGSDNQPSFVPNFIVYFMVTSTAGVFICCLRGKVKVGPKPSVWKDLKEILKIWETHMLLVLAFVFGFLLSAISTLLPLYITNFADGNEILVALSFVLNLVGEIPMLFLANRIIDSLGYVRCLYLVCVAFFLRFFLYTVIFDPWYILPVNLLHGFTFGIMFTTLTAYMSRLTPPALHGTTQGLVSTLAWNLGSGCGSIVSGEMMERIGARKTFAIFSACSLAALLIYFTYINVIVRLCTRNKNNRSNNREFKMVSTEALSAAESVQPLLTTDDSDNDKYD